MLIHFLILLLANCVHYLLLFLLEEDEVVQEKEPEAEERLVDLDKEVLPDPGTPSVETPAVGTEGEEVELDAVAPAIDIPAKDKFTNDLDPAPKEPKTESTKK